MPDRSTVQNYIKDSGTLFEDFEPGTGWAKLNGGGTLTWDTTYYQTGTRSMKLTAAAGDYIGARCTPGTSSTEWIGGTKVVHFYIYCHHNPFSQAMNIKFRWYTNFASSIYFEYVVDESYPFVPGWNHVTFALSQCTAYNGASWNDPITNYFIKLDASTGGERSISVDNFRHSVEQLPRFIVAFDDGWSSVYDSAYPIMQALGIKGTVYVTSGFVGLPSYVSLSNLNTLYGSGWALGNHTATHPVLSTLTSAEIETELTTCQNWLIANGFTRALKHVAYPSGGWNQDVLNVVSSMGMLTGRRTGYYRFWPPRLEEQIYLLNGMSLSSTLTLSAAKTQVDFALSTGAMMIIYGHSFVESGPAGAQWTIADFQALMNYMIERKCEFNTICQWYEGLRNSRYRDTAVTRAAR